MPKAHFDEAAVCRAAIESADGPHCGITVSTNHPAGFRRVMYKHMRAVPEDRVMILQSIDSATSFMLVPQTTYEEAMANAEEE